MNKENIVKEISKLPQKNFIYKEDAEKWVDRTLRIDPERIMWHIKRAGGIGGSEAGTLVSWAYNEINSRETAYRLAQKKFFIIPPDRQNDDTGRGIFLEEHIKKVYENKLTRSGVEWRERKDLQDKIESSAHPQYPWLRASLDGVYEINGKIVITDFKAPSETSLENYKRYNDYGEYECQLNHYALVAEGHGITIDKLDLAFYDYRHVASIGVEVVDIPLSPIVQNKIIEASNMFWNEYILKGNLPENSRKDTVVIDEMPEELKNISQKAVITKLSLDRLDKQYKEAQSDIGHWIKENGGTDGKLVAVGNFVDGEPGVLEFKSTKVFDIDEGINRLKDLGMSEEDIETLRGPEQFDSKKVMNVAPIMSELIKKIHDKVINKEEISEEDIKDMENFMKKMPVKDKGNYDENLIKEALAKYGENEYPEKEQMSSGLTRKKNVGLDEMRSFVEDPVDNFVFDLVSCKREDYIGDTKNDINM